MTHILFYGIMAYKDLINELIDSKRVPGQDFPRPPNSLELRAARAIYSLLLQLHNATFQGPHPDPANSASTGAGSEEPVERTN